MLKSIWRSKIIYILKSLVQGIGIMTFSLFAAFLITTTIHWFVPLSHDQIELINYIAFIICFGGLIYYYVD